MSPRNLLSVSSPTLVLEVWAAAPNSLAKLLGIELRSQSLCRKHLTNFPAFTSYRFSHLHIISDMSLLCIKGLKRQQKNSTSRCILKKKIKSRDFHEVMCYFKTHVDRSFTDNRQKMRTVHVSTD